MGRNKEITILYDNVSANKKVKPAWGFSALVTFGGKNLLFDTGGKADILLSNMKALRISPKTVTAIFISHNHWDHTGGLFGFLSGNNKVKVFLPASCSDAYMNEIRASGAKCIGVKGPTKIAKGIYSSGELGEEIKEQALVLKTPKGLIIMTGCAHPGILKIVKEVKRSLNKPVIAVLGGFHLASKNAMEVKRIIAEFKHLGVAYAGPCHCTGKKAIRQFKAVFEDGFIPVGAGRTIII